MSGILKCMLLFVVVSGCGANSQATRQANDLMATMIFSREECNLNSSSERAVWINSENGLSSVFHDINAHIISDDPLFLPEVDFSTEAVLLIEMGQQPSSGYYLNVADPIISVTGKTANVVLEWHAPEPGVMTASVITHPCSLVKMPLSIYSAISVRDTLGKTRASLAVQ